MFETKYQIFLFKEICRGQSLFVAYIHNRHKLLEDKNITHPLPGTLAYSPITNYYTHDSAFSHNYR